MSLLPGDVVLIEIQFHQAAGRKVRPAVVVLDSGDDDFVGAPITSRARHSDFDFEISDWQFAARNVPSVVRLHKLAVLSKTDILRPLGRLSEADLGHFGEHLCRAYCLKGRQES